MLKVINIKNLKKSASLYFLAICSFFSLHSQSTYHKMLGDSNKWYVSGHFLGVKPSGVSTTTNIGEPCVGYYEANKDSVYAGKTYKKFVYNTGSGFCYSFSGNKTKALIREDTISKKIYSIAANDLSEELVMDFSLSVGDSLYLFFGAPSLTPLFDNYYKVDSIILINELVGTRKHFYLSCYNAPLNTITGNKFYIEWIESIGATHFPISLAKMNTNLDLLNMTCLKNQFNYFVTCKWTNSVKYYQDSCSLKYAQSNPSQGYIFFGNTCEFYSFSGGVKELSFLKQIELFPNPTPNNSFTLKFEALLFKPLNVIIYNALGQQVYFKTIYISTATNSIQFDDIDLPKGLFTLQLKSTDESAVIKFIRN